MYQISKYPKPRQLRAPWKMVGRYTDGFEEEVIGRDEGDCIGKLAEMQYLHGKLYWYTGVNDDEYIDGELRPDAGGDI